MANNNRLPYERRSASRTPWKSTGAELSSFVGAEIFAEGVWLGAAALMGAMPKSLMNQASSVVGKVCIEPFLGPIEKALSKVCRLKECQPDESLPKEERAKNLARVIITYAPAIALALEMKVRARKYLNGKMDIRPDSPSKFLPKDASMLKKITHYATLGHWSPQEKMIFLVDEGTQIGSFLMLNNQLAPFTDDMIQNTSGALQRTFHMDKKKADEWGTASWMWVVPNAMGGVAASIMIAGKHFANWPKGWVGRMLGRTSHDITEHGL